MLNRLLSSAYSHQHDSWNVPASMSQLKAVNSLLSDYCEDRNERLVLLAQWFGHPFFTSKQLTKAEASALVECGYRGEWEHSPDFVEFIQESLAKVYQF